MKSQIIRDAVAAAVKRGENIILVELSELIPQKIDEKTEKALLLIANRPK